MPRGWAVPGLEMRRISCPLRLSLLPEMGQRARISISETQRLPLLKCLATGWFASLLVRARQHFKHYGVLDLIVLYPDLGRCVIDQCSPGIDYLFRTVFSCDAALFLFRTAAFRAVFITLFCRNAAIVFAYEASAVLTAHCSVCFMNVSAK